MSCKKSDKNGFFSCWMFPVGYCIQDESNPLKKSPFKKSIINFFYIFFKFKSSFQTLHGKITQQTQTMHLMHSPRMMVTSTMAKLEMEQIVAHHQPPIMAWVNRPHFKCLTLPTNRSIMTLAVMGTDMEANITGEYIFWIA